MWQALVCHTTSVSAVFFMLLVGWGVLHSKGLTSLDKYVMESKMCRFCCESKSPPLPMQLPNRDQTQKLPQTADNTAKLDKTHNKTPQTPASQPRGCWSSASLHLKNKAFKAVRSLHFTSHLHPCQTTTIAGGPSWALYTEELLRANPQGRDTKTITIILPVFMRRRIKEEWY